MPEIPVPKSFRRGDRRKRLHDRRRSDSGGKNRATDQKAEDDQVPDDSNGGCRRIKERSRRRDTLARAIIRGLKAAGFNWVAEQVRVASKKKLVGPTVMLVSALFAFAFFAQQLGWLRSGAIILGLMVHESGHYFFTLLRGKHPHWWWFTPVGVFMHPPEIDGRADEAWIALGGPLVGVIFSLGAFGAGMLLPLPVAWVAACFISAKYGFILNLFNLIPISPLDGGRITQASHWFFQVIGFVLLLLASWWLKQPMLLLVWMIIAIEKFMGFPVWRFVAALGILVAMGFLIGATFEGGHLVENIAYFVFGVVLVLMSRPSQYVGDDNAEEYPQLPRWERFLWGLGWTSLTITAFVLYVVVVANQPAGL